MRLKRHIPFSSSCVRAHEGLGFIGGTEAAEEWAHGLSFPAPLWHRPDKSRHQARPWFGEDRMAADTQAKSAELAARLARLPFSKWHRNFFAVCFLGVMFDACDFALFGMALPPVAREFGLNPAEAGLLATVGLIGAFLGALFWGTISDYIGRRTSFSATIGIFSLFTGLVGASWNVLSLGVFRLLSNFGLGGAVPVPPPPAAEHSPARTPGLMPASMMAAFPVGLALAAVISVWLIP